MKPSTTIRLIGMLLVVTLNQTRGAPGDLDLSFDAGSSLDRSVNVIVHAMAAQSDGKIIVGGGLDQYGPPAAPTLLRLNADGSPDKSFLGDVGSGWVGAIALQNDGKILLGGGFTSVNGLPRPWLARLNPDGSSDPEFLSGQAGPNGLVYRIKVQPDGRILIAGGFKTVNGEARGSVARLNVDGSLDTTFLNGLPGADQTILGIALQDDGRVIICGSFNAINGVAQRGIARLNADGSLDPGFNVSFSQSDSTVGFVAVQPDRRILITGWFTSLNGVENSGIARLNADGTLDTSFVAVADRGPLATQVYPQADGRILIGGSFHTVNGIDRKCVARLNADGSLDTSFQPILLREMSDMGVRVCLFGEDGRIVLGGGFTFFADDWVGKYLCRLNSDGSLDPTFNTGAGGPEFEVRRVVSQPEGRVLIGGWIQAVQGFPAGNLARLMPNGKVDTTFLHGLVGADGAVWALVPHSDGRILVGGEFRSFNGVSRPGIVRLNGDGSLDTSFLDGLAGPMGNSGFPGYVYAARVMGDGKILIGGAFTSVNGVARNNLARLDPDGALDTSFTGSVPGGTVFALTVQEDGRIIIAGGFSGGIARLHADGSPDISFRNNLRGADQTIWAVAVQHDGKVLIGGWFNTVNDLSRKGIARLNPDGSLDMTFLQGLPGTYVSVFSLALQSDRKILVGGSFWTSATSWANLARLNPDGSRDLSFLNGQVGPNEEVWAVTPQADGRILIGGRFTLVNGVPRDRVARLMGDFLPPSILLQPQSRTAEIGSVVVMSIQAGGQPVPCCQWFFNGTNALAGCTNLVLRLTYAQPANSGVYSVVVTNIVGAVTSSPAIVSVIAPVERRLVPDLNVAGEPGRVMNLDYLDAEFDQPAWMPLASVPLAGASGSYFDLTALGPPQRYYRAWQPGPLTVVPTLDIHLVPAITLTGPVGTAIRVDGINQVGSTEAWFALDTVTLTNTTQLYFDVSVIGQPKRLYRLVLLP